jgi:hypothetical protein
MKKIILLALLSTILSSCATQDQNVERLSAQARINDTTPLCEGQQQCQNKWDAAQVWVSNNAGFKILTRWLKHTIHQKAVWIWQ